MGIIIKDGVQYGNQPDSYTKTETNTLLNAKQNTLTFDNTPTASSQNPVTSDGIKTALDGKVNTSDIYNALDKTQTGSALDARQGKTLNDAIAATQSDIAIIINGNQTTHTGGAAVGEYVIVCNSTISGITDGLYKAVQAIPANTAITSAYLAAVSGGLGSEVAAVNSNISKYIQVLTETITYTEANAPVRSTVLLNSLGLSSPPRAIFLIPTSSGLISKYSDYYIREADTAKVIFDSWASEAGYQVWKIVVIA